MASTVGFTVEGLNKVVRDLISMGLTVDDLKDAFSKIAGEAAEVVSENTPRRSGRLAGDVRGNRAKNKAVVTAGRVSVPYAGPINYGWPRRNIRGSGFMQTADEHVNAVAILEDEINKQIQERGLS